jgi:organic hydroperoxide reductase OsmC/OhrA
MNTIYTAVATVHGGREGHVKSDDGLLDLDLSLVLTRPSLGASWGARDVGHLESTSA